MILLSPGGTTTQRRDKPSGTLLVGSTEGVFRFNRNAKGRWVLVGRALEGVFVSALSLDPGGRLYAATHGLGIAISDDEGRTWCWSNGGLEQLDAWVVKCERIHGRDLIFTGTLPAHLFVSDDRGEHWAELPALRRVPSATSWSFPPPPHVGHVLDIAALEDRLYVGIEVGALLRSDDAGVSFLELPVDPQISEVDIHKLALHPARPNQILCATGWGIIVSSDAGLTWTRNKALPAIDYPVPLVMHPDDPNILFVAGGEGWPPQWYEIGRSRAKIARTRDGGLHWERLLGGLPDGQRPTYAGLALEAWNEGFAVYAGDTDGQIFESTDGGDLWSIVAEAAPLSKGDQHRGLSKGRPRLAGVDELRFTGPGLARVLAASSEGPS
jgi:photosystem II stability/assembly factor-like uncharacterized protein